MTNTTTQQETRPPSRRRGIIVAIIAVALTVAAGKGLVGRLSGGGEAAAGPPGGMPPMPVDVDTARRRTVIDAVRATGRIEAVQAVELRPDEQGRITDLLFREGQAAVAGVPLIKMDDEMLRAQAERAAAERDLARQQLERARRLRAENASSPADVERAEAAARSADAALALLQLQIERTTVRAPFSGVVGQRFVSQGDYVTPATRLLTLQTMDPQRVVIEVSERHAAQLKRGQAIEFTVAAYPERVFRAEVEFIDPVVQNANRTITVKARAANPGRLLKAGMFVEARLATDTRADAIVVPEDAVQPLRTGNVVWAIVDGKASRRAVELGARAPGIVEVTKGVEAGELVVVGGLERMGEGLPVAPQARVRAGGAPAPEAGGQPPK